MKMNAKFLFSTLLTSIVCVGCMEPDDPTMYHPKAKTPAVDPNPPTPAVNPAPNPNPGDDSDLLESRVDFEARRADRIKSARAGRAKALTVLDENGKIKVKMEAASQFVQDLDFQSWGPFKSAEEEKSERNDLFDSSIKEFIEVWKRYSAQVSPGAFEAHQLNTPWLPNQALSSLASNLDAVSSEQSRIARRAGFNEESVFSLIRNAVNAARTSGGSLVNYQATVLMNKTVISEVLQWRGNLLYESIYKNLDQNLTLFHNIRINKFKDEDINPTLELFKLAEANSQLFADFAGQAVVSDYIRSNFGKIKLDNAESDLEKLADAQKKVLLKRVIEAIKRAKLTMGVE